VVSHLQGLSRATASRLAFPSEAAALRIPLNRCKHQSLQCQSRSGAVELHTLLRDHPDIGRAEGPGWDARSHPAVRGVRWGRRDSARWRSCCG